MLFDATERNVDPFLCPARIRTMKKLILALAIHDKNVTMARPSQVAFIIWTRLTPPSEDCSAAKPHRNGGLGSPNPPLPPTQTEAHHRSASEHTSSVSDTSPSAHHGFIRGAIALHTPASSGQHRSPVHGPIAGPCPYAYEQVHEE